MLTSSQLTAIHAILEDIAGLVGAPALVEDAEHIVIAYSEHDEPGDPVRASTILGKRASAEVAAWLAAMQISDCAGPVQVPPNPALGMQARICFPLRGRDELLGYLWFIDPDLDMSDFDLERAGSSAQALIRCLLPRRPQGETVAPTAMRDALRGSPTPSPVLQRLSDRRLETGGVYRVAAIRAVGAHPSAPVVRHVLTRLTRQLEQASPLSSVVDDVGRVLFVDHQGSPDPAALALRVTAGIADEVVVGVGDPVGDLSSMALADTTALDAATCAALWPQLAPVVNWPDGDLYRLVPACAHPRSPTAEIVRQLRALIRSADHEHLATTVETYLDLAGHAQETAAALTLHRATLYQRLQRFVEVTGLDIKDGPVRSFVHLSLKAARFAEFRQSVDTCRHLRRN